jgi:hypothetical protein
VTDSKVLFTFESLQRHGLYKTLSKSRSSDQPIAK